MRGAAEEIAIQKLCLNNAQRKPGTAPAQAGGRPVRIWPPGPRAKALPGTAASVEETASIFGEGLSEAEAQLYAYLDLMTNSKPQSGFPPLDELNARLNEEPYRDSLLHAPLSEEHYKDSLLFPRADEADLLFSSSRR